MKLVLLLNTASSDSAEADVLAHLLVNKSISF
jgi:hypothetical protein